MNRPEDLQEWFEARDIDQETLDEARVIYDYITHLESRITALQGLVLEAESKVTAVEKERDALREALNRIEKFCNDDLNAEKASAFAVLVCHGVGVDAARKSGVVE